jgi:hypothetical protein
MPDSRHAAAWLFAACVVGNVAIAMGAGKSADITNGETVGDDAFWVTST